MTGKLPDSAGERNGRRPAQGRSDRFAFSASPDCLTVPTIPVGLREIPW